MEYFKTKLTKDEFDELPCDVYSEDELEDMYQDYIDDMYDEWEFNGTIYYPSHVFRSEDPIGFERGFDEYCGENFIEIELADGYEYIINKYDLDLVEEKEV